MLKNDTEIKVLSVIKKVVYEKQISLLDRFSNLNIDSLAFVEMIVCFEEEFNIKFENDELVVSSFNTIEELIICINKKINQKRKNMGE